MCLCTCTKRMKDQQKEPKIIKHKQNPNPEWEVSLTQPSSTVFLKFFEMVNVVYLRAYIGTLLRF